MPSSRPLPPGSTIGILGGGQLGRMTAMAAARLGYPCIVYAPDEDPVAAQVCAGHVRGAYEDAEALTRFAAQVDVVTYEFENVPEAAVLECEKLKPVRPGVKPIHFAQHRLREKDFLRKLGIGTADYEPIRTEADIAAATALPGILKTCTEGYDGKGQARVADRAELSAAWARLGRRECILEAMVDFDCEVSAIVARGLDGATRCFPIGINGHRDGILRTTTVPARLSPALRSDAVLIAARILNALDYVGVMGVELFVTAKGLLVNEIAPRVHNSGHWTQAGCTVDQFEQHIRAVAGLPLGDGGRYADVVMENLIGDDVLRVPDLLKARDTAVHLYGKGAPRPGRKMGHVNRITRP